MKFSEKLTKLRKESKMSQQELAEYLDVSRQAVSKWESGISYPEMDKLLILCKLFKCSLDDLTNDEKSEITIEENNKNSNLVVSFLDLIVKTLDMFRSMRFKQLVECIFSMGFLFFCLLALLIPGYLLYSGGLDIINNLFPYSVFRNIWSFITLFLYLFFFIITFFYVFKKRYLDNFVLKEKVIKNNTDNIVVKDSENKEYTPKELVIVQKEKDNTIFKMFIKIFIICFKCFFFLFLIPFIISFIVLFALLIIDIILLFKGVLYIGVTLGIIFSIVLNYVLLELSYDFLFNKKIMLKRIFIMIIVSLAGIGISGGLFAYEISNIEYDDNQIVLNETKCEKEFAINKNMYILAGDNIEFRKDDLLKDKVKVEITYNKNYRNMDVKLFNDYGIGIYPFEANDNNANKEIMNMLIKDLKNKKVRNYSSLYNYHVTIISNSKTIDMILENSKKKEIELEKKYKLERENHLQQVINEKDEKISKYEIEIDNLNDTIDSLKEENQNLQSEIENLKNKIQEYKENLNNLLEG